MHIPPPIFIGFRVKSVSRTEWLQQFGGYCLAVREICSISDCIAKAPPGWVERWDFNVACCYSSEAQALATVLSGMEANYELFAYRMFPLEFGKSDTPRQFDISKEWVDWQISLPPECDLGDYVQIGHDIAGGPYMDLECGRTPMIGFSCSPLSCNGMAAEFPVNRYCLIDDINVAIRVAQNFGQTEPETGPFYLYEVLRKRSDKWQP